MSDLEIINFTRQGKRFAVKSFEIKGLEDDENGSILITEEWGRILIDEDFDTAFNRINGLDTWDEKCLK